VRARSCPINVRPQKPFLAVILKAVLNGLPEIALTGEATIPEGESTMADLSGLSDEALAVFAFAAYHQLSSGQMVKSVVQRDGVGHKASDTAVSELKGRGLIEADGDEIRFTGDGEQALQAFVAGLRGAGAT
jgi:hypothetical protein